MIIVELDLSMSAVGALLTCYGGLPMCDRDPRVDGFAQRVGLIHDRKFSLVVDSLCRCAHGYLLSVVWGA